MSEVEQGPVVESVVETAKQAKPAKRGKGKGKPRKARRETISAAKFVEIYQPMALAGKSAKEIAAAMGRDETFVSVRATSLRKAIAKGCKAKNFTEEQTAAALAKVPFLSGRGGADVLKMLGIVE